jgi:hypothetical protein
MKLPSTATELSPPAKEAVLKRSKAVAGVKEVEITLF